MWGGLPATGSSLFSVSSRLSAGGLVCMHKHISIDWAEEPVLYVVILQLICTIYCTCML